MRGPGPANFLHSFGVLVLIFIRDESCQFCDLPDVADLSHATIDISNLLPQGPHPWEKGNSVVFARSIVVDINVLSFFPLRCCAHTSNLFVCLLLDLLGLFFYLMDGWTDGRMDGWMDGWLARWMDEWMNG